MYVYHVYYRGWFRPEYYWGCYHPYEYWRCEHPLEQWAMPAMFTMGHHRYQPCKKRYHRDSKYLGLWGDTHHP